MMRMRPAVGRSTIESLLLSLRVRPDAEFPMPVDEETPERRENLMTLSTEDMAVLRCFDWASAPW